MHKQIITYQKPIDFEDEKAAQSVNDFKSNGPEKRTANHSY